GANCSTLGPFTKATLSLYAETISFGCCLDVSFINLKSELGFSSPSITKVPLNILWRQCSELTCENPNTSESVKGLAIFFETPSKYSISSSFKANPSCWLYAEI